MSFIGMYVDLTGSDLNGFVVQSLAGRDGQGAPRWRIVCGTCGMEQVVNHSKLAPLINYQADGQNIRCVSPACPLSRTQLIDSESLVRARIRERKEAREAEMRAAQSAADSDATSTAQRARDAKATALKDQYRRYWLHQIRTSIAEDKILTLDEWRRLSESTRQMILDKLSTDPTAYVEF